MSLRLLLHNVFRPSVYLPTDLLSIFDPYGNAVHTALSFNMVGEDVIITGAGHQKVTFSLLARIGLQELNLGRVHVHSHSRGLLGEGRVSRVCEQCLLNLIELGQILCT